MSLSKLPKYRKNGQYAFVQIDCQRIMLGRYDSDESRKKYQRLIAEWAAAGGMLPVEPGGATLCELIAQFYRHCQSYYRRPDGNQTTEVGNYKQALKLVNNLYGDQPAKAFGPAQLETVRAEMIKKKWVRQQCNRQTSRIKRMFRWAVVRGICKAEQVTALDCLEPLKRGRCDAVEGKKVVGVKPEQITALESLVSKPIWALIQLQLLTGARSGELLPLRQVDLEMTGTIWRYQPTHHKMSHADRERVVFFGPRAQEILRGFFDRAIDAPLFSPRDVRRGSNAAYSKDSYRRAIARACEIAGIEPWHPHQLRHAAATRIRQTYGLEAAQVILGHARADVTEIYAQRDQAKAAAIVAQVG
ncbi:MAG: tyrosine-type recombinase/integrase [Sedimentisphaerales bacterium]|nr:tyrosine-type recombinase/integrase [Sedimentisphaerales bacterium]